MRVHGLMPIAILDAGLLTLWDLWVFRYARVRMVDRHTFFVLWLFGMLMIFFWIWTGSHHIRGFSGLIHYFGSLLATPTHAAGARVGQKVSYLLRE